MDVAIIDHSEGAACCAMTFLKETGLNFASTTAFRQVVRRWVLVMGQP
jgi:hypothetical protein